MVKVLLYKGVESDIDRYAGSSPASSTNFLRAWAGWVCTYFGSRTSEIRFLDARPFLGGIA